MFTEDVKQQYNNIFDDVCSLKLLEVNIPNNITLEILLAFDFKNIIFFSNILIKFSKSSIKIHTSVKCYPVIEYACSMRSTSTLLLLETVMLFVT